eukprot:4393201-Ditylum_brightwellii.AAC.1
MVLQWGCVKKQCGECGVDKKFGITECKIWGECKIEMDVLEWIEAPRQGTTNEKQNTQLELGQRRYVVKEAIKKFVSQLNLFHLHKAKYEWKHCMMKRDMTMAKAEKHGVLCTNLWSTLDLFVSEKDNLNVGNPAVFSIFFILSNWRNVKYKIENGEYKDTTIND